MKTNALAKFWESLLTVADKMDEGKIRRIEAHHELVNISANMFADRQTLPQICLADEMALGMSIESWAMWVRPYVATPVCKEPRAWKKTMPEVAGMIREMAEKCCVGPIISDDEDMSPAGPM